MNEKNFGYLGSPFQQSLLKIIIEDKKFAMTIIDVMDSKYFDGPYFKYIMQNIKELYVKFGTIPNYETLDQKIMAENTNITSRVHADTLRDIKEKEIDGEGQYVKKTSLNFCRQQVLKKALKESEEIMINGDFEEYDKIEGKIQSALQVGSSTDGFENICDNVEESLDEDSRVPFPTGVTGVDNLLKGGLAKGEMAIFLAPTGVGKTTWLTKVANSAYGVGANVLHIFFEDNMVDIRRKHYTIWTGVVSDDQPKHKNEIVDFMKHMKEERKNILKLIKLPGVGTTISEIKNKIRKLASEGFKIDMLVIDYIDCISSEGTTNGEEWKGEGSIMRSLESITDEFNIALWTATQGNRDSITSEIVTANQIGGSIKKAQIGHVIISAGKTLEQKENNLATLTLLKSRIGKDGIVFSNCLFNNEMLEIDTDAQNTLLGHSIEKEKQKKQRAIDLYREKKENEKFKLEIDIETLKEKKKMISDEFVGLKNEVKSEIKQIKKVEINHLTHEMTPEEKINRAAKVYSDSKLRSSRVVMNSG